MFPEITDLSKISKNSLNREVIEQRLQILKKSCTFPSQLNAEQKNQKQVLIQKMEILTENEHNRSEISPLALGNIPNGAKNTETHSLEKVKEKKEAKPEEYLPHVTITKVMFILQKDPKQTH